MTSEYLGTVAAGSFVPMYLVVVVWPIPACFRVPISRSYLPRILSHPPAPKKEGHLYWECICKVNMVLYGIGARSPR